MKQKAAGNTLPRITEKAFQGQIASLARQCGWLCFHPYDSRRSAFGYPDLTLLHPKRRRLVMAELKVGKNKCTVDQEYWLDSFRAAGVEAYLWTPACWDAIERILTGNES